MKSSREGKRFILASVLIAVAALNTGNNLIYLILSMMLSILLLSVLILHINLKGLKVRVSQTQPIFSNQRGMVDIAVTNLKKRIPSYSVKALIGEEKTGIGYFQCIPHSAVMVNRVSVVFKKRGMYGHDIFTVESGFPFIFFAKKTRPGTEGSVTVYPEIRESDRWLSEMLREGYERLLPGSGKADEFSAIREFRYGDDWRKIHWKASAKTDKMMVMEYAADEPKKLTVILDNLKPLYPESFEKAVSLAATISDRFLREDFFVRLLTCRKVIPFGSGRDHLLKILDILAVIEGQESWEFPLSPEAISEGYSVLILNSAQSPLKKIISSSNAVIYASTL